MTVHPFARRRRPDGFTLLEGVVALLIVAILVALVAPNYDKIVASAQQVKCASQMRSIRLALDHYLEDHRSIWPQGPPPQEPGWSAFWLTTLAPYGITEKTWQCPVIQRWEALAGEQEYNLHYVPTTFDPTPNIARRWSQMPWLIEIADAHGKGPLVAFPDGTIKPYSKVLADQGVR